jgi:hypothetical protein
MKLLNKSGTIKSSGGMSLIGKVPDEPKEEERANL